MKVALRLIIEVDPETWASEYGLDVSEVREDVKAMCTAELAQGAMAERMGLKVRRIP